MSLERPTLGINTYKCFDQTVPDGTSDLAVDFGFSAVDTIIINDGLAAVSVKLNASTNDTIFIASGETWSWSNIIVDKIFLSNGSGQGNALRISCYGAEVL